MAAAFELSEAGLDVTVLEKTSHPGGLGRSFEDPGGGGELDNGQHLMLASYTETFGLLKRCGVEPDLDIPAGLSLVFRESGGRVTKFSCPPLPSFLALPLGLLGLKGLSAAEKFRALSGPLRGGFLRTEGMTVEQLLDRWRQPESLRRLFWRPLALGTLNTEAGEASAQVFLQVLWQGFLKHPFKSRLALPRTGLSRLFPDPVRKALESRSARISFNDPALTVEFSGPRLSSVHSRKESREADLVISALPWKEAAELFPGLPGADWAASPIVTAYVWLSRPLLDGAMVGLLDLPFDWVFDRGRLLGPGPGRGPLALVKSAATELSTLDPGRIGDLAWKTLVQAFPDLAGRPERIAVYKEMRATFKSVPDLEGRRPGPRTAYRNLFLAGAWTDTGLPATLEGAVRSGRRAARAAIESLS